MAAAISHATACPSVRGAAVRRHVRASAAPMSFRTVAPQKARFVSPVKGKVSGSVAPSRVMAAVAAEAPAAAAAPSAPSHAETARTIVELVGCGTLSTLGGSGIPLGTFVTYVLDKDGLPLLRLRKDAIHTGNLMSNPSCSLFVHAPLQPIRSVARITLLGAVEGISEEERADAQARHAKANTSAIGVDAPREDDIFMRLKVVQGFYVGGLGSDGAAEEIPLAAFSAAEVDTLAESAPELVGFMNSERPMDIVRITGDVIPDGGIDDVAEAELLWIDKLGVYIRAVVNSQERVVRVNFTHEAIDERDARSCLTMMAQLAWENERNYQPAPVPKSNA